MSQESLVEKEEASTSTDGLRALKEFAFKDLPFDAKYKRERKLLLTAYEISSGATREQQTEINNILSKYDPIMWDLILKYGEDLRPDVYSEYLKELIFTTDKHEEDIKKDYIEAVARPKTKEHEEFVRANMTSRTLIVAAFSGIVLLGVLAGAFTGYNS